MDVVVVIPALNEECSIGKVLAELKAEFIKAIVVADNGSTDNTAQVASSYGAHVVFEPQRGYGKACLTGLETAYEYQSEYIAFIDADYSDNPKNIYDLYSKLQEGYDFVVGSRMISKVSRKALLPQAKFGNWLATNLMYHFFGGTRYTDLGPFRVIKTSALKSLLMQDQNFGWTIEMQVKATLKKINSVEIPVDYKPRIGKSKISGTLKGSFLAGYIILKTIFVLYIKKNKLFTHINERKNELKAN